MRSIRKSLGVAVFALMIAVCALAPPASAESELPAFGCNADGCSIWVLDYAWPDSITVNALDFVRLQINVNRLDTVFSGRVQYLGILCQIPLLSVTSACGWSGTTVSLEPGDFDAPNLALHLRRYEPGSAWVPVATSPGFDLWYAYRA